MKALVCLTFALQLARALAVCPPPYSIILGVCLHYGAAPTTWCDAQVYCTSVGGELVRGSSYLPLAGVTFPNMPERYWIGLTDMLHERRNNRTGWRWTDGALLPSSAALVWHGREPGNNGPKEDCVMQYQNSCLLYTSPSPRDLSTSRMPSSA